MKFTLSELQKYISFNDDITIEDISNTLTNIGLEIEEVIDYKEKLSDFKVAKIISYEKHKDADKLNICMVKTSSSDEDGLLQIICGAHNVRDDMMVVLAPIGSIIPNGNFKIKKSQIRGVDSHGMLASGYELGISDDHDGILDLPQDAIIGEEASKYLGFDDVIFEINITPNRADALSIYGIAKDLSAAKIGVFKPIDEEEFEIKNQTHIKNFPEAFEINVNSQYSTIACFAKIDNIKNNNSPNWLKNFLKLIGINPVSLSVDVTNYISYLFGQPMHAYDSNLVSSITIDKYLNLEKTKEDSVEKNGEGENKFLALDNKSYKIEDQDIVIYDKTNQKILSLAGIIGGENSSCNDQTDSILLEAAVFDKISITKTGRRLNINTDSRYRFERYVDPTQTQKIFNFAINMITKFGEANLSYIYLNDEGLKTKELDNRKILINMDFIREKLSINITNGEIITLLEDLSFKVKIQEKNSNLNESKNEIEITIPSNRYDVNIKEDILEEVARIYGYDKIIPVSLKKRDYNRNYDANYIFDQDIYLRQMMGGKSYHEVVTYSFVNSNIAKYFTNQLSDNLYLENPITNELDYMRPSLLPNLLKIAKNNISRSINNVRLFEKGPVFFSKKETRINKDFEVSDESFFNHLDNDYVENEMMCGIKIGNVGDRNIYDNRSFDVYDVKADLYRLLSLYGKDGNFKISQDLELIPSYYNGAKSAAVYMGKKLVGFFGVLKRNINKLFSIEKEIFTFELFLDSMPNLKYKNNMNRIVPIFSDYQLSSRDFAFILSKDVLVGDLLNQISKIDKNLIKNVNLFDLYNIDDKNHSVAFEILMQATNRTLNEEDINNISNKVISLVEEKFKGKLRDDK